MTTNFDCVLCGSTGHAHPSELDQQDGRRYVRIYCARCGTFHIEVKLLRESATDSDRAAAMKHILRLEGSDQEVALSAKGPRGLKITSFQVRKAG